VVKLAALGGSPRGREPGTGAGSRHEVDAMAGARGERPGAVGPGRRAWSADPRLWASLVLGAAGVVAAVASGRPEPVVLAAPMLMAALVGVVAAGGPEAAVTVHVEPDRVTEGDELLLVVELATPDEGAVTVLLDLPPGLVAVDGSTRRTLWIGAGEGRIEVALRAQRWGSFPVGGLRLRRAGPLSVLSTDIQLPPSAVVRVYPAVATLRRLAKARETSLAAGNQVARAKGSGVEFADMRPYAPGDRVREINWRVTARRNALWVNERHPERANDVVVFVDAFRADELARAVPAADAVVRAYLARRDRVGLVSFGGTVRWVRPGTGLRQQYLVVDALLATSAFHSVAWRDLDVVPPGVLPSHALVIAVSPLRDPRGIAALWDLRSRGADLAILELEPPPLEAGRRPDPVAALADRIQRLQRGVARDRFRALGVPVSRLTADRPLAEAIEELGAWPNRVRPAG
jgi:uncharacterized protein (DUF58 family)